MPFSNVGELNAHLATRSYVTGFSLSNEDRAAFEALSGFPDKATNPHAYRWALHVLALCGPSVSFKGTSSGAKAASAPAPKKAAPADDFDDLFGDEPAPQAAAQETDNIFEDDADESVEDRAANKARRERMEAARKLKEEKDAKDGKKKEKKEKPAEKSLVVLEVKPWEADTDLKMVWEKIREYQQEGLTWGESYKLEPVAFGIMKLVMTATIVDALVLMDDITENIEALEEWVQSVNVASMNKI